jgi:hypothetical protein
MESAHRNAWSFWITWFAEFSNWADESHTPLDPLSRGEVEFFAFVNSICIMIFLVLVNQK